MESSSAQGTEPAFRAQIRAFVDDHLDPETRQALFVGKRLGKEQIVAWQRQLDDRGWAAPGWPVEYGGPGWSLYQQHVFAEELALAPAPGPLSYNIRMLGPVLIAFGSEEQKRRFLPRMRRLDDWWCQGFSEPEAGSDLASLRVSARRDGDFYVVNGQKTWTSLAQWADWMFCLVRTNPHADRRQEGISFLLIDMRSPGVSVRPIGLVNGEAEVCDVFFDDVEVPVGNLVGEENRGWEYANHLLASERVGIAGTGETRFLLSRLDALARVVPGPESAALADDPVFREQRALLEADLTALEGTQLRILRDDAVAPREVASVLKIKGTEIRQAVTELLIDAAGPEGLWSPREPRGGDEFAAATSAIYLGERATTIYGGSTEIQTDIIALQLLGPRA